MIDHDEKVTFVHDGIFENLDFGWFGQCILYSWLATIQRKTIEHHSSKQMMIYDRIASFMYDSFFDAFRFKIKDQGLRTKDQGGHESEIRTLFERYAP